MFMEIAITAIGIAIVLMIGYLVVAQVRAALPTSGINAAYSNQCFGLIGADRTGFTTTCWNTTPSSSYHTASCGVAFEANGSNASAMITCPNTGVETGINSAQTTVFAGFGLVAVGIIVLAAFGLVSIFRQ